MKAMYPGSFDPLHNGHLDVITVAAKMFVQLVVSPMRNPQKASPMFTDDERLTMIAESVAHLRNVEVVSFEGLVVDAAARLDAGVIVKGLRSAGDFETEMRMAHMNYSITGVETVLLPTRPETSFIASVFIREITAEGRDCSHLVPPPVAARLAQMPSRSA